MSVRQSAWWMRQLDERILEYLAEEEWGTPEMMEANADFGVSIGQIRERCQMLQFAGLIVPLYGDAWELTTDGQQYLDGEIDARYRPRPTVDRVLRG